MNAYIRGLVLVMFLATLSTPARGQTAPDGNAHPQTRNISQQSAGLANPFGEHVVDREKVASTQQKSDFAAKVQLDGLRDLAVFHNGRVKILQTLAQETVENLTGRRRYVDFIKSGDEKALSVKDVAFDPLFTLLDLTIDPAYYIDKPLIGVAFLPLREEIIIAQFPADNEEAARERWKKLARVTPMMVDKHLPKVMDRHSGEEAYVRAAGRVDSAQRLFMESKANFEMVAPERTDLPWVHLAGLDASSPISAAAQELGAGWRAMDAARVNAAVVTLATELPKVHPDVYPNTPRALEGAYNKLNAFEWGYWAYFLALLSLLIALGTGRVFLMWVGGGLLLAALAMHTTGFVLRCLIAERFAIQNQFESMTGLSLFAVVLGLIVMVVRKQWIFGAAAAAVGFMVLLTATQAGIPGVSIEREAAILNTSVLLKYHVTTVLVSYGLISLGFVCSLFYLGAYYLKPASAMTMAAAGGMTVGGGAGMNVSQGGVISNDPGANITTGKVRLLSDLDTAQLIIMQLAFWTLGVGILLGAWWADHSWGRWWAFDPKETWALITWIVYLIVVHVRVGAPAKKGITTAWLSVVGFIIMLWTYFGVNLLLPGLHAYA